jgi:pimeloyl-ACP methyl ester carboxylesterase
MHIAIRRNKTNLPRTAGRALSMSLVAVGATLAASAVYVQWRSRQAEHRNPPTGKFVIIGGTRLHYTDTGGPGPGVVLLHGNSSMTKEMEISGIVDELANNYRVITCDRPGFGYSSRPRSVSWTPAAQADLLHIALLRLGINGEIALGHSWGTLVALELALRHPDFTRGLLLVSGYYFPVPRRDIAVLSLSSIPIIGNVMRYTISPLIAKALAPMVIRRSFAPRPVSERFTEQFPIDLALRPLHLRASAEDLALTIPATAALQARYPEIRQPTIIIAGSEDRIVDIARQSVRLHDAIPNSELYVLPNDGHMVHHHAPLTIFQAMDKLAGYSASLKAAGTNR